MNDACINFYWTRLQQQLEEAEDDKDDSAVSTNKHSNSNSSSSSSSSNSSSKFKFVDPSVLSFFMHQYDLQQNTEDDEEEEDILGIQNTCNACNVLSDHSNNDGVLMFLPINDNYVSQTWTIPGGGTHWSLLLLALNYEKNSDSSNTNSTNRSSRPIPSTMMFWHFDSSRTGCGYSCNKKAATEVARKIQQVVVGKQSTDSTLLPPPPPPLQLIECSSMPQQQNGYDCGLYTLGAAKEIFDAFSSTTTTPTTSTSTPITFPPTTNILEHILQTSQLKSPSFCKNLRQQMLKDVQDLLS